MWVDPNHPGTKVQVSEVEAAEFDARNNDIRADIFVDSQFAVIRNEYKDSDDPNKQQKLDMFFDKFSNLPFWYQSLFIGVVASIYGLKGADIFKKK